MIDFSKYEIDLFYEGSNGRTYKSLPYVKVDRPITRQVNVLGETSDRQITWYERPEGRCGIAHKKYVMADYWIVFTLGRRLECICGKNVEIEVY